MNCFFIRRIMLPVLVLVLAGCGIKAPETKSKKPTEKSISRADSLQAIIDSVRLYSMHQGFVGVHVHGLSYGRKDLAAHAHQNPVRALKVRKFYTQNTPLRVRATKRLNIQRALERGDTALAQKFALDTLDFNSQTKSLDTTTWIPPVDQQTQSADFPSSVPKSNQ